MRLLSFVAALTIAAFPVSAMAASGFQMPSGNVFCMLEESDGSQPDDVRCDIMQMTNRRPRPPADCELDWGDAFVISAGSPRGERMCHGDTVRDPSMPVLPYGSVWRGAGITCMSAPVGVTCQNADGHGFSLARAQQRVF